MKQPLGYIDKQFPIHVCKLNKAIYGLKQALRSWFARLSDFLFLIGFHNSLTNVSFSVCSGFNYNVWILVYVDDMIIIVVNAHAV